MLARICNLSTSSLKSWMRKTIEASSNWSSHVLTFYDPFWLLLTLRGTWVWITNFLCKSLSLISISWNVGRDFGSLSNKEIKKVVGILYASDITHCIWWWKRNLANKGKFVILLLRLNKRPGPTAFYKRSPLWIDVLWNLQPFIHEPYSSNNLQESLLIKF